MRYGIVGFLVCTVLSPATAFAESRTWQDGDQTWIQQGPCIVVQQPCEEPADRALRMMPDPSPHRLLYLNRCAGGETFTSGYQDDARLNESSIIRSGERVMSEFPHSDATWDKVVGSVRRFYAPFNVRVTDVDPGTTPHGEIAICGSGAEWGIVNSGNTYVAGISPKRCNVIPYSISFVFPVDIGNRPEMIAETAAHEAGHALSLDHELLCEDLMSYDCTEAKEGFVDQVSPCVVYDDDLVATTVDCSCEPPEGQNTYESLLAAFGPGTPALPKVAITTPTYNQVVEPGFPVQIEITDPYNSIARAELWVDDENTFTLTTPPFAFNGPTTLADGGHRVEVRVTGVFGEAADDIMVVSGVPCQGADDCALSEVCVEGRCVVGPDLPGGLGEECASGDDCVSGLCANDGVIKRCTEICNPSSQRCPDDFACMHAGADDGVCWPSVDESLVGGGCVTAREPAVPYLPIALALLGAVALLGRRRRPR